MSKQKVKFGIFGGVEMEWVEITGIAIGLPIPPGKTLIKYNKDGTKTITIEPITKDDPIFNASHPDFTPGF